MSDKANCSARLGVIGAAVVVVVLAAALAAALLGGTEPPASGSPVPPPATVPAPHPCDVRSLELPCWGCLWAEKWPLHYRTDLDMLAPLGTGTANAAAWFAQFARPNGLRHVEAEAAMARRVDHGPVLPIAPEGFAVLPAHDPLLLEAEPWCDQATMRFYPEIFEVKGGETQIPNVLLAITFARAWIARGTDAASFDAAMDDFRRVIRLGRLLRQDDVVLMDDLVGLILVRWGAEAIYARARQEGKTELALLAAIVVGEGAAQRSLTAARQTTIETQPYLHKDAAGRYSLDLPSHTLKAVEETATSSPDRRFRVEGVVALRLIAGVGRAEIREEARALLGKLAQDGDAIVAANASWCVSHPVSETDDLDRWIQVSP